MQDLIEQVEDRCNMQAVIREVAVTDPHTTATAASGLHALEQTEYVVPVGTIDSIMDSLEKSGDVKAAIYYELSRN